MREIDNFTVVRYILLSGRRGCTVACCPSRTNPSFGSRRRGLLAKRHLIKHVPCNGCTLCCQGDAVRLEPEDLSMGYQTEPHPYIPGALMIAHKSNGECIYLDEHGCSIHDHAPSMCRTADCRSLAARISFESAKALHQLGRLDIRVWDQGHRLLEATAAQGGKLKQKQKGV